MQYVAKYVILPNHCRLSQKTVSKWCHVEVDRTVSFFLSFVVFHELSMEGGQLSLHSYLNGNLSVMNLMELTSSLPDGYNG